MKITDDYKAKIRFWAENPTVAPLPAPPRLPEFTSKKFRNHSEMNQWKKELLLQLARSL